jgi:hypothetical protein
VVLGHGLPDPEIAGMGARDELFKVVNAGRGLGGRR